MLQVSIISALILLESRELFHGLISQPFFISLIFIFFGYEPQFVLITATVIHLIYINITPSGTSLFPEYPFGFFLVVSLAEPSFSCTTRILISIVLIILMSRLTALFIKLKRTLSEKYKDRFHYYRNFPDIRIAVLFSFFISFLYALLSAGLIKVIFFLIELSPINNSKMVYPDRIMILIPIGLALFYAYQNFNPVKR